MRRGRGKRRPYAERLDAAGQAHFIGPADGTARPGPSPDIVVQFRCAPLKLFKGARADTLDPNLLVVRIQPDEGISLRFQAKVPGAPVRLGNVDMAFNDADYFAAAPAHGYETLRYDCMNGDPTLFLRADMVEAGWDVVAPILDIIDASPGALLLSTRPAAGGPPKPTRSSRETAARGETPSSDGVCARRLRR